jgi:ABC-2 type transport system ATP-binding protein
MTPAIETRGLTKRYRRVTALSDCSIAVPEGRISALVGPNGAGKTTLLRLLSGLASPTSGDAAILGSTPRQDPAFLAEIGFLAVGTLSGGPAGPGGPGAHAGQAAAGAAA